jgi:putative heme-binding domain-containing protein
MLAGLHVAVILAGLSPGVAPAAEVILRTVPNRMVFDRTRVYVEAGKPVVLVVENRDIMPHNLVVATPGSLVEVGLAAERMAGEADAQARGFIPRSGKVLHALPLVEPGGVGRLAFRAPREAGEYPFACTLPGHWRIMNGVLVVVPSLAAVPPEALRAPAEPVGEGRPFVHRWVFDELAPELRHLDGGRSFARGRALFAAAACVQCHRVKGQEQGGDFGPDLGALPAKLADGTFTRADVLRAVLEPSREIDPKYRPVLIETRDGGLVSGIVVGRDAKALRVLAGPQAAPREVPLGTIVDQVDSKVSLMPEGLLVTLSKEEILDLLAYVIAGGDPGHRAFAN